MTSRRLVFEKIVPPFIVLVLTLSTWELLCRFQWISPFVMPSPVEVLRATFIEREILWEGFLSTLTSSLSGLLLSFVVGTLSGLLFSASSWARKAIYPYATFFQTVPIIAIAPLLVIWFGFGKPTVISASFIVSVFSVIANTMNGLQSVGQEWTDLFEVYGASKSDIFLKLKIPFALPSIFSGLRIAAGLAIIGAIVGEFIAGGGLGSVVDSARTQQRLDLVYAAVIISSFLGILFIAFINYLSWFFLHNWHASEKI